MSKNIPDSCWNNDPSAPWNDIAITYSYSISIELDEIKFSSEVIKDTCIFNHFEIKSEDDWMFVENNLYMVIEDSLSKEILRLPYKINLINFSY